MAAFVCTRLVRISGSLGKPPAEQNGRIRRQRGRGACQSQSARRAGWWPPEALLAPTLQRLPAWILSFRLRCCPARGRNSVSPPTTSPSEVQRHHSSPQPRCTRAPAQSRGSPSDQYWTGPESKTHPFPAASPGADEHAEAHAHHCAPLSQVLQIRSQEDSDLEQNMEL